MLKKIITYVFLLTLLTANLIGINTSPASASTLTNSNSVQDEFINKIIDFVEYDSNNKPYFITEDLSILKITQQELDDVKKGFEIANNFEAKVVEEELETESEINQRYIASYDSSYIYISFSANEVKAALSVGIVAGLALSIAGTVMSGGTVLVIAGITITKGVLVSALGASMSAFTSLITLWWNPTTVTLKIPIPIFRPKSGNVEYAGRNSVGLNQSKYAYISF